jgi:hypothetical protein
MTTPAKPIQRFQLGSIRLAVWENRDRQGRGYYTTSIARSYRDDKGQWTDTGSLRPSDLPVVRDLSAKALDWISAHPPAAGEQGEQDIEPEPAVDVRIAQIARLIERQFAR